MKFGIFRATRRFLKAPKQRRVLFVEAWLLLGTARLLLRLLSFQQLTRIFNHRLGALNITARESIRREIRSAIETASTCLPGKTVCFPKAIAAQIMCRNRGINSTMYYGVATNNSGLTAHVWVQDGVEGVIGHRLADQYHVLTSFPASGQNNGELE